MVALLGSVMIAAPASAAAPTPESLTSCGGSLKHAAKPTVDDPNLLDYKFDCDGGITSYTLVVNRGLSDDSTLDDFSSSVGVFDISGNAVATASFSCSGTIPGNGVNCNAGAGGRLTSPDFAEGTVDTSDPYCANIPPGSPPGTQPEPTALVQLVVTDRTGAEDGPFRLRLAGSCPAVHVVKPKPKPKHKKHGPKKGSRKKSTRKTASR